MSRVATAVLVKVTPDPLELQQVTNFVQDDSAGAIATFSGVTRDSFNGKKVVHLEYEAYGVMAEKVLQVCLIFAGFLSVSGLLCSSSRCKHNDCAAEFVQPSQQQVVFD